MKAQAKFRVSGFEFRARPCANTRHSSFVIRQFRNAFTLIELLTVIAIIGLLAALLAPVLKNFSKPEANVAATRQLLDDCARARALAVSERSTVYMVFIPTNFWGTWGGFPTPPVLNGTSWGQVPAAITNSTVTVQAYGAQLNGYMLVSLRDVGDQPGRPIPKTLQPIKTLPQGAFIAPFKFTTIPYGFGTPPYPTNRPDLPIYSFPRTNGIPFPTVDLITNVAFMTQINTGSAHYITMPYVAFNYLGQLTAGDGSVLDHDENIPLDYGNIAPALNATNKLPTQAVPAVTEEPPGNSTNISYNVIHIDRLTGRARLERQDQL